MKQKTIADITIEVLKETGNSGVMWGDTYLLDEIAIKCTHTNLVGHEVHPLNRHKRILDALDKDDRFEKFYIRMRGMKGNLWRSFRLKDSVNRS